MSLPLDKWIERVKNKYTNVPKGIERSRIFMRDPMRKTNIDPTKFYSPADGIIIYQKYAKHNDVVDIKGKEYSISDLIEDNTFKSPCLVIGIFMTVYDVHVNRIPYSGVLTFEELTPILSNNMPMDFVQDDIISDKIKDIIPDMEYVRRNARMVNKIYSTKLDYSYYVTQIADDEVNVISHFTTRQHKHFNQNQRFSFVRWGSQVELILPLVPEQFKFKLLVPETHHVCAGIDALVEIIKSE